MARRSDHTRDELRDLALSAARAIVEAEGFGALTARRLARELGYSPGTLYNLFANFDDLVVQLNARTLTLLDDRLANARLTGDPKADALALALAYFAFATDRPRLWELLFEYRFAEWTEVPDWFSAMIGALLSRLTAVLAPLFGPGEKERLDGSAKALWAGLHGIGLLAASGKLSVVAGLGADELAGCLVANFVGGIVAAKRES